MLVFIIDGYNLVHSIPGVKKSDIPQLDLIRFIRAKNLSGSKNNKVILVFDGWSSARIDPGPGFEVVFSNDKTADDLIKERAARGKNKSQIRVVTDDREIRDFCRLQRVECLHTFEFTSEPAKVIKKPEEHTKDISYSTQSQITEEMRKIWLDKKM